MLVCQLDSSFSGTFLLTLKLRSCSVFVASGEKGFIESWRKVGERISSTWGYCVLLCASGVSEYVLYDSVAAGDDDDDCRQNTQCKTTSIRILKRNYSSRTYGERAVLSKLMVLHVWKVEKALNYVAPFSSLCFYVLHRKCGFVHENDTDAIFSPTES